MIITIPGEPVPQARMKVSSRGKFAHIYEPPKCAAAKKEIRASIKKTIAEIPDYVMPINPHIGFVFLMEIPKSIRKSEKELYNSGRLKHLKKPDVDNLLKLYLDCMDGLVFEGDQKVSLSFSFKLYHPNPKTVIWITDSTQLLDHKDFPSIDFDSL